MNTIRFGIISTSAITKRFIEGVKQVEGCSVQSIYSRSIKHAQAFVANHPDVRPYSDLTMFLQDANIDAIYIASPNFTHKDYIMKALSAHKHVLCEKPMVLSEADVHACFQYAKAQGCLLMEAMKPCFLPTTLQAQAWIKQKKIGTLRYMEASNCGNNVGPFLQGWHGVIQKGGGALYDIGVYPIAFLNCIEQSTIVKVQSMARMLNDRIDAMSILQLQYQSGVMAQITCGIDTPMQNKAILYGTLGSIEIENFWKSERATLHTGDETITFYEPHMQSEFQYQIRSFVQAIKQGAIEHTFMGETQSARNAWVIDQTFKKRGY